MKPAAEACLACQGHAFRTVGPYRECLDCGHGTKPVHASTLMVNEELDATVLRNINALERFKRGVTLAAAVRHDLCVDIGSGSGRFLLHVKDHFRAHLGVEVTPECVRFSREELGLNVASSVEALVDTPSVVTLWHSLEHIPVDGVAPLLDHLARVSNQDTRVVVCVPNGASLQSRVLGPRYAFHDPDNHVHQFTSRSLDLVFRRHGMSRCATLAAPVYSAFGYLQGALNVHLPPRLHNYFYARRKRGQAFGMGLPQRVAYDAWCAALLAAYAAPAVALTALDGLVPRLGAVLLAVYRLERAA